MRKQIGARMPEGDQECFEKQPYAVLTKFSIANGRSCCSSTSNGCPREIKPALAATHTFTHLPKDRLSKSLDPENAGRFGWQAWRAARAQYPRFACHADRPGARSSAARPPAMLLQSRPRYRNPTRGFLIPLAASGQTPLPAFAAAGLMAAAPGRDTPRTA